LASIPGLHKGLKIPALGCPKCTVPASWEFSFLEELLVGEKRISLHIYMGEWDMLLTSQKGTLDNLRVEMQPIWTLLTKVATIG
jgi:hypothetical protein